MKADEIARYLQDHPNFFEEYAELLAQLYIPHPHGGRAISITERQILTLREKARQLESKLGELIRFGEENDAIGEKVHRLAAALAGARGFDAVRRALLTHLGEDFSVPHVAFRLWALPAPDGAAEFAEVGEQTRIFAAGMNHPFCGANAGFEAAAWFGEAGGQVRSVALIPLRRDAETVGLLALGSEDVQRFYPEMGTLFLGHIGELASAALLRTLE
ncbi:MAG: hypothetical protein EFKGCFLK_00727 [Rhodocyclaceae bacterium]|nr:MAG: DUF484 family protein [Rhodocyclaceae bacterium]MBE7424134.1 DUF484 family protein [Zoogloeaceae bacterium]MBV6407174.1 hypothetical protein [Rhodocyclaceae bacterium]MCK6383617.1 DUF484 family protein [Rhodocyclaceae bacterium]CAG0929258.1 hypothetical protein RHDC3_01086 [Rhodocyclaceae bacterium]